jgi:hypothetical protein
MKILLEKTITMDKVYQVKALPPKENSKYKYRDDAYEHIESLTYGLGDWKKDNG